MKKYIYVTPYFPAEGSWRCSYAYDFVRAVERTGKYKVEVFVEGDGGDYEVGGVRVHSFSVRKLPSNVLPFLWRRRNDASFLKAISAAGIAIEDVAVCHGNTAVFAEYPLAVKRVNPKCKTILHHHDLNSFGLKNGVLWHCWPYNMLMFPVLRRLHEQIDLHVFVSEAGRRSFLAAPDTSWTTYGYYTKQMRGLPYRSAKIGKSVVLHNGVDRSVFKPGVRKEHEGFVIGCVGNFAEMKDQITLLRAVDILSRVEHVERVDGSAVSTTNYQLPTTNSIKVIFIGSGERRRQCEEYAREKGLDAEFRDEVMHEKLAEFYREIDLFVLPSFFEGFGCVYTEAWCCGTPFIACEGQGIEDVVPEEDRGRWLCRQRDPEDLAEKIRGYREKRWEQRLTEEPGIDGLVGRFLRGLEER